MKANRKNRWVLVAVSMIAGVMLQANAASIYWNGAGEDANWSNPTNWSGNVKPGAGDITYLGSVVQANASAVINQAETCGPMVLANAPGSKAWLMIADGGLTTSGIDIASPGAGNAAEAHMVQSNGVVITTNLTLGKYASATGSYELVNGTLNVDNYLYAGQTGGNGTFVQRNGSATCKYLWIGYGDNSYGRYELHGGLLSTTTSMNIGLVDQGQQGTFLQTGGTNLPLTLTIGDYVGSTGEYQMSAGLLKVLAPKGTSIGNHGYGVLTQTGGAVNVESYLYIGYYSSGKGYYHLQGGELIFTNTCYVLVGHNGKGTFRLGDANGTGTLVKGDSNVNFYIRNVETSDGTLTGWGSMPDLYLQNNGRVIADGYGTERTLDLSTLKTLAVKKPGLTYTSTHGWFARNRGALRLKDIGAGANFYWGDNASSSGQTVTNQPLVNSVKFVCTGASGTLTGRLLATDHADVRPGLERPLSVWDFSGVTHTTADVTIRYDDLAATASNVTSANLRLFQHDGTGWHNRTVSIDPVTKTITAALLSPVSQLAVASIRPGTLLMVQ